MSVLQFPTKTSEVEEMCAWLLERARAGEIDFMCVALVYVNGEMGHAFAGDCTPMQRIGMLGITTNEEHRRQQEYED